jgi:hypothetical protein
MGPALAPPLCGARPITTRIGFALLVRCARAAHTLSYPHGDTKGDEFSCRCAPPIWQLESLSLARPYRPSHVIHDDLAHGLPTARHHVPCTQIARWPQVLRGFARRDPNCLEMRTVVSERVSLAVIPSIREVIPGSAHYAVPIKSTKSVQRVEGTLAVAGAVQSLRHVSVLRLATAQSPARIAALSRKSLPSRT